MHLFASALQPIVYAVLAYTLLVTVIENQAYICAQLLTCVRWGSETPI